MDIPLENLDPSSSRLLDPDANTLPNTTIYRSYDGEITGEVSVKFNKRDKLKNKRIQPVRIDEFDEPQFKNKVKDYIFRFVSCICSFMFLSSLMNIALLYAIWETFIKKPPPRDNQLLLLERERAKNRLENENKLVFDLKHYFEIHDLRLEEFNIVTSDGFILQAQRIINPRENKSYRDRRYPVLLLHGLLQSSAAFCTSGEYGIAFYLFRAGYDVWLGNNRCGFSPSSHVKYKYGDRRMWEWDIIDMGTKDLPCMIDFILSKTVNNEKLALVAHSQGTTQTFIALAKSERPDIGKRISCICALAPAVYGGPLLDKPYWKFIKGLPKSIYSVFFGLHAFMPIMLSMHSLMNERVYGFLGYLMFHFLFDWKDTLWDHNIRSRHFIFSPVYVSSELMRWWLGKGGFNGRRCIFDEESDGHTAWYDSTFPPLALFIPHNDGLTDGLKLLHRIEHYEPDVQLKAAIHLPEYSHLDVLWAMDVNERVSVHIKRVIWETAHNKEEKICPL